MSFAYVQGTGSATNNTTSLAVAFAGNVTAGHLIVVGCTSNATTTHTIADSQGNAYTQAVTLQWITTQRTSLYYAVAKATGPCTVTMTPSASAAMALSIDEFSFAGTSSLDGTSTGTDGGTLGLAMTAGTITPTGTDLVIAVGTLLGNHGTNSYTVTPATGFTATYNQAGDAASGIKTQTTEYQIGVTGAVAPSMGASTGNATNWAIVAAAFKESATSGRLILAPWDGGFRDLFHGGFRN